MEIVDAVLKGIELLKNSWQTINNFVNYSKVLDEKIETMKTKSEKLISRKKDIKAQVRYQTHTGGKKPKMEVENWLKEVQQKKGEVQKIQEKAGKIRYLSRLWFLKLVEKATQEVDELTEQGKFPEGLLIDVHQDREMVLLTMPSKGQTKKESYMNTVWECLMKNDIHRIGVHGMGGVGKTTILLDINNKIKESIPSTFDHVYWVTVSQASSIYKLQNDIAKVLNLDLSDEPDERRRTATLFKELIWRKKFVLILDDLWKAFAPENVGIPIGVNGGKLIITTRLKEVCRRMNCEEYIKVEPLSEKEAWDLFLETLGHETVLSLEVQEIAKSVAEECNRLPLDIITTAGSMKGIVDIREWRNALKELREPTKGLIDRETEVFKRLKFSYDHLNDEKLQQCFLYCALFPKQYWIRRVYLITCWIAEGLVDELETRQAEFDQGHTLINKLETAGLLEPAYDINGAVCVKMPDAIRDMALRLTRENSQFMVRARAQLNELPDESKWSENLERVSLMVNNIEQLASISPKCPRLHTLLLQFNPWANGIPNFLFVYMPNLRVLDLSYSKIQLLPDSISDLQNLRALLLNRCTDLRSVPSLAKLTKLKDLYLFGVQIAELPDGMEKLVNLKNLALYSSIKSFLYQELPDSISHLRSLISCFVDNDVQLKALVNLRKLEFLFVHFFDLHQFNSYVKSKHWQMLACYNLKVERYLSWYLRVIDEEATSLSKEKKDEEARQQYSVKFSRQATINSCNLLGGEGFLLLPNNILEFIIEHCNDLNSLSDISSTLKNATELKRCRISICEKMENIWSFPLSLSEEEGSERYSNSDTPKRNSLTTLDLQSLPNLSSIFKFKGVEVPPPKCGIFSNLKLLRVLECHKLRYLFPRGLVQHHLQNLEVIDVCSCNEIKKIIQKDKEEEDTDESNFHYNDSEYIITFPKLRTLALRKLPNLKSIWSGTMVCHSLQQIGIEECPVLNRLPFSAHLNNVDANASSSMVPNLRKISGEKEWQKFLEWDHPNTKSMLDPLFGTYETIFSTFAEEDELSRKDAEWYEVLEGIQL